jgi:hypothetical protein
MKSADLHLILLAGSKPKQAFRFSKSRSDLYLSSLLIAHATFDDQPPLMLLIFNHIIVARFMRA